MLALTGQTANTTDWQSANGRGFDQGTNDKVTARRHAGAVRPHLTLLARTVEAEVLPRLLLAHQTLPAPAPAGLASPSSDVSELVALVLEQDTGIAGDFVESLRRRSMPAAAIYLDVLAPTARRLGELWEEDRCDFTQVTLGLMRLQQALRMLSPDFLADASRNAPMARVLLVAAPGEQHTFGLAMVGEFFRRAGWSVSGGPAAGQADTLEKVRHTAFAVVGISIGSAQRIDDVGRLIRAIRRASCNRAVGVMVGGPLVACHPEIAAMVGADATAADGQQAVLQAQALLSLMA